MSDSPEPSAVSSSSDGLPSIIIIDPPTSAATGIADSANESRLRRWMAVVASRFNRMLMILTYPFMVVFTVASLLMVITFCIFPTLICMTFGVCIYYCLMEDPIPLSVLLRYMLSPDPEDSNYPHPYPYSQNRGAIQAKLIIRRILRIEDVEDPDDDGTEKEEHPPRRHPFPIEFKTKKKCFHFSEPIVYEEKDHKQDDKETADHVPYYQRTELSSARAAGATADVENNFSTELSVELATPPDDVELGLVEIAIGSADSDEAHTDRGQSPCPPLHVADDEPSDDNNDDTKPPATNSCDANDQECSHHDHGPADLTTSSEPPSQPVATPASASTTVGGVAVAATEQLEEVMEMVEDYFGITDSRERGTTCDICLLDFEVDEEVAWSPNPDCVHSFHKECILDWLIRKPSCPSCRNNYLEGKSDDNA